MRRLLSAVACLVLLGSLGVSACDPPDPVLRWNTLAIDAVADDHSGIYGPPVHGGPGKASRTLAIVQAAVYDAVNSIDGGHEPYLGAVPVTSPASMRAATAAAAHDTLVALYPAHADVFDDAYERDVYKLGGIGVESVANGIAVGQAAASAILAARTGDGSDAAMMYTPGTQPGEHRPDPTNPGQGFLGPMWGDVTPFAVASGSQFQAPPPPALDSPEYTAAYNEVLDLGGDGDGTPTLRTAEQTEIGLYWGYDGAIGLGPPPRLYNQIVQKIARAQDNTLVENARLFALVNLAQADAGITCWESKYVYNLWRPVLGIRESDPGTGPSGLGDGNGDTLGDVGWTPLGAPASNQSNGGLNFTPPFPAYPSGHATFGASVFRTVALFYGTDAIPFTFVSDELNGVTTDNLGNPRPLAPRSFALLSDATAENAQSRIYLGVHWQFDATAGMDMGTAIADYIFANALQPVP